MESAASVGADSTAITATAVTDRGKLLFWVMARILSAKELPTLQIAGRRQRADCSSGGRTRLNMMSSSTS